MSKNVTLVLLSQFPRATFVYQCRPSSAGIIAVLIAELMQLLRLPVSVVYSFYQTLLFELKNL